jgi:hypothetical protein
MLAVSNPGLPTRGRAEGAIESRLSLALGYEKHTGIAD